MCLSCSWEDEKDRIESMLNNGRFDFAMDTLEGILVWVQEQEHVTANQKRAIDNIENSVND